MDKSGRINSFSAASTHSMMAGSRAPENRLDLMPGFFISDSHRALKTGSV
jgi:hypothetical protein